MWFEMCVVAVCVSVCVLTLPIGTSRMRASVVGISMVGNSYLRGMSSMG